MQLMLIEIHKERRKQCRLQQIMNAQQEEMERHEDYNPWADDAEYDRRRMMKDSLGNAMNDPEKALPRYCWRKPALNNDGR